jgi:energy-coupling factor transport system ATP-binding protein
MAPSNIIVITNMSDFTLVKGTGFQRGIGLGIIEVDNLRYTYPNVESPALKGVDLTIDEGEFILLTGPSGCGKTTFSRCLNGLIPHFYSGTIEGSVNVNGLDVREHATSKLALDVGLIFQNPDNQIFALTVEKDVAFGLENLGIPKEQMMEDIGWALDATGIEHLKNRGTHELSGGQKQRLAIASILAMKPKILVLDEPTSFLDTISAERSFKVLDALNRDHGITIILIEHRVDLAAKYVDKVVVFGDGWIKNMGPPEDIFLREETRLAGVGIPRLVELTRKLRNRSMSLPETPLSPEAFIQQINPLIQKAGPQSEKTLHPNLEEFAGEHRSNPLIRVEGLTFAYPNGVQVLKDFSLTIHAGEFIAIMGENGAGKTTLVKHLNGLLRPQAGIITLEDTDIADLSVAALARKVGLVFQNPDDQLFSENVESEISFALDNFGFEKEVVKNRVDWSLNLLDIEKYRESSPFILSGGERKRVALASVLAWDPDVVVLDEPTIGQDYRQKEKLRHFLAQLRTQGKTIIIVTHDVEFVAECEPRIVLMAQGEIIGDGTTKEIMTDVEAMDRASVAPPMITKVFSKLSEYGLPENVVDVDEAVSLLIRLKEGSD